MTSESGVIVGLILTLFVYSFLVKDNPLYRLAIHILVGVSAAYAAVLITRQVIVPVFGQIRENPSSTEALLWLVPLLLALLLVVRRLPSIGWLGNGTIALLVGIGAAVALIGAISGTLLPQLTTVNQGHPVEGFFIAVLTVCTLLTFQFTGRLGQDGEWQRPRWQGGLVVIGRIVLTVTFAVLFTGVFGTSVLLLIDRVNLYLDYFTGLLS
jgi:hypothetical protein